MERNFGTVTVNWARKEMTTKIHAIASNAELSSTRRVGDDGDLSWSALETTADDIESASAFGIVVAVVLGGVVLLKLLKAAE